MSDVTERTLCQLPSCHVFKIPVRKSADGHRAADWPKDSIWSGKLKIIARDRDCFILLIDEKNNNIFATCPVDGDGAVERALDSGRYYVLRIKNPQGKHAFIGLAFNERNDAFDFNVALQEHKSELEREDKAAQIGDVSITGPLKDLSIKDGEKIKINISGVPSRREKKAAGGVGGGGGGLGLGLPPPPDSASSRSTPSPSPSSRPPQHPPQSRQPPQSLMDDLLFATPAAAPAPSTDPFSLDPFMSAPTSAYASASVSDPFASSSASSSSSSDPFGFAFSSNAAAPSSSFSDPFAAPPSSAFSAPSSTVELDAFGFPVYSSSSTAVKAAPATRPSSSSEGSLLDFNF